MKLAYFVLSTIFPSKITIIQQEEHYTSCIIVVTTTIASSTLLLSVQHYCAITTSIFSFGCFITEFVSNKCVVVL